MGIVTEEKTIDCVIAFNTQLRQTPQASQIELLNLKNIAFNFEKVPIEKYYQKYYKIHVQQKTKRYRNIIDQYITPNIIF